MRSVSQRWFSRSWADVSRLPKAVQAEFYPSLNEHVPKHAFPLQCESRVKVRWRCQSCSGQYDAPVHQRVANTAMCPRCMCSEPMLGQVAPVLAADFDEKANDRRLSSVRPTDRKTSCAWQCQQCGSGWRETALSRYERWQRTRHSECPSCETFRLSNGAESLADLPGLANELCITSSLEKEGGLRSLSVSSEQMLSWICSRCVYRFDASVCDRVRRGIGCPACQGKAVTDNTLLSVCRPDVFTEMVQVQTIAARRVASLTIASDTPVVFCCRTCMATYTMSVRSRCLYPVGEPACPSCRRSPLIVRERRLKRAKLTRLTKHRIVQQL